MYIKELHNICKIILEESTTTLKTKRVKREEAKKVITHELSILYKDAIYKATASFPDKISLLKRILAIFYQKDGTCPICKKVHGDYLKLYCSAECKNKTIKYAGSSPKEKAIMNSIDHGEEKYVNKQEGYDYLICQICGAKGADLSTHVRLHDMTTKEYKEKFNLTSLKSQYLRDKFKGENNPGYNHGGKFSAWSKNFIHGYDEERHEEFKDKMSEFMKTCEESPFLFAYWLNKANGNEELAKELYVKHQTRSLDWFIEKFGPDEGPIRYQAKTDKWLDTLNSKPIEELEEINAKKARKTSAFFSKAEQELFDILQVHFPKLTDQKAICQDITAKNKQFYLYDMALGNKIIEYNGDFWHANPEVVDDDFVNPLSKQTKQQIHDRDNHKRIIAENAGYQVMVVWETDYHSDKEEVIKKCIQFLKE